MMIGVVITVNGCSYYNQPLCLSVYTGIYILDSGIHGKTERLIIILATIDGDDNIGPMIDEVLVKHDAH